MDLVPKFAFGICSVMSAICIIFAAKASTKIKKISTERHFAAGAYFSFYAEVMALAKSRGYSFNQTDIEQQQIWGPPLKNAYSYLLQASEGADPTSIVYPSNLNPYTLQDYGKQHLSKLNTFLTEKDNEILDLEQTELWAIALSLLSQAALLFY